MVVSVYEVVESVVNATVAETEHRQSAVSSEVTSAGRMRHQRISH